MRRLCALVLLLLSGCASLPSGLSIGSLPTNEADQARFVFYEQTQFPHVVTEIRSSRGWVLVECWKADPLTNIDYHWGMEDGEVRQCFTYPAEVQDAAWSFGGFAQLAQNKNGTAVTNIGPLFNETYQRNNPTWRKQGRVVSEDRKQGVRWSITRVKDSYEIRIYR